MVMDWPLEQIRVVTPERDLRLVGVLFGAQIKRKLVGLEFFLLHQVVEERLEVVGCHLRIR